MLTVFPGVGEAPLHSRYRNLYRPHSKTMLNINDQLLANAKTLAAQQQTGLTRLIEEGLRLRAKKSLDRMLEMAGATVGRGDLGPVKISGD